MDGYRVGDCGLVPEDRVVAFVVSKTRKRGAAPGWSRPPFFWLVSAEVISAPYVATFLKTGKGAAVGRFASGPVSLML